MRVWPFIPRHGHDQLAAPEQIDFHQVYHSLDVLRLLLAISRPTGRHGELRWGQIRMALKVRSKSFTGLTFCNRFEAWS